MLDFLNDFTTTALVICVSLTVHLLKIKLKSNKSTPSNSNIQVEAGRTYVPLLQYENGYQIMVHRGVSTISFFSAQEVDYEVSKQKLKARVRMICEANPWLVGKLVMDKGRHERIMCSFPNAINDEDIDAVFLSEASVSLEKISSSSPYPEIAEAMDKFGARVWKTGYDLLNQQDRTCKVSLFKVNGGTEFAFIFSVSHAVVDGYTYYKLLSMFRDDSTIESLQMQRLDNFDDVMAKTVGTEEAEMLLSSYFIRNLVCRRFFPHSHPNKVSANYIDPAKIAKAKQEAKREHTEDPNFYVSTNDIITSVFGKAVDCNLLLMLLNMRGRVQEVDKRLAGNYEVVLCLDRDSYDKPSKIRHCLNGGPPFKRTSGKATMTQWQQMTTDIAMISSWIFPSFDGDIHLWKEDGSPSSLVRLHLPLYPGFSSYPSAIVFKPCKGRLGVFSFHHSEDKDDFHKRLVESGNILGEPVSSGMFASM